MRMRIGVLALGGLLAVPLLAAAQPRTSPPTLDFTCHGYDEGATRAYNCVPPPSEQHHMRTFMPAVGSPCDQGLVREFPPGRIVFQVRCQDTGDPPPPSSVDFEIADVQRYAGLTTTGDWLYFRWIAHTSASSFRVSVRFQQGPFQTECVDTFYDPRPGLWETDSAIPHLCGTDEQWSQVTISPLDGKRCKGCGTYQRAALRARNSLLAESADPAEVPSFIDEFSFRVQVGAARR